MIFILIALALAANRFRPALSPVFTTPSTTPSPPLRSNTTQPRTIKVMVLDFNPAIPSHDRQRIRAIMNWADPKELEREFIAMVSELSGGALNYRIVTRKDNIDSLLVLQDGYLYTPDDYFRVATNSLPHHKPEIINYQHLLSAYHICDLVNSRQIDELWLWGAPWLGFYEAVMAGPGAINTNAPPITGTSCKRQLNIMGFSYERGISEMLEDLGHRLEGVMADRFGEDPRWLPSQTTEWGIFVSTHGWMHQPPNILYSAKHYVYDDPSAQNFPCRVWGCTNMGFKKWWFQSLPPDWWAYLLQTTE